MATFLQNTNEFPLFWRGPPRRPRHPGPFPCCELMMSGGADGLETLKSLRAGRTESWEAGEVGSSRKWEVWKGGALLARVVAIGDASWKGVRVGGHDVPEDCRGVARLRRGAKC